MTPSFWEPSEIPGKAGNHRTRDSSHPAVRAGSVHQPPPRQELRPHPLTGKAPGRRED